ncbi:hypothetical protein SynBIOSE41_03726 [Synechococcus sp. BIOS-E4-1]|nr:hypothetical protein SynBIOSE41_03726 [Synechococcus sp. BIOS-E4-1]
MAGDGARPQPSESVSDTKVFQSTLTRRPEIVNCPETLALLVFA